MQDIQTKQKLILEHKNLYKGILILALPIFFSNLLRSLHDLVDMYFISPLGDNAITSISITMPIIMISQSLIIGFMIAGAAMISQYLGAKQKESAEKIASQLFLLCALGGVVFNVLLWVFTPQIMQWMGTSGETLDLSITYVRTRSFELVPMFTFFAFQASRQASGDTVTPVVFTIVSILLNILFTWFFIAVLELGVMGAALATVVGQVVIMPFFLYLLFYAKGDIVRVDPKKLMFERDTASSIMKLGWPSSVSQAFTALGFIVLNAFILSYGEATVSAFSVGNRINSLILMPAMGIGGVVATFVGQNIGANNPKRARESIRASMILTLIIMTLGAALLMPLRHIAADFFLKQGSESYHLSIEYMFFVFTTLPMMGIFQVFMGAYQGAGRTNFSLILAVTRLWMMRVPLVLLFKDVFGLPQSGIWYAMVLSNFGAGFVGMTLYYFVDFRPKITQHF